MLLFLGAFVALFGLSLSCITPDGRRGQCVSLRECTELYNVVAQVMAFNRQLTGYERWYLTQSQCGGFQNSPQVCCASGGYSAPTGGGSSTGASGGSSVPSGGDSSAVASGGSSVPSGGGSSTGTSGGSSAPSGGGSSTGASGGSPANVLPPRGQCGMGSSNRIYGGEETDLDEFPWNCLIEYLMPNNQTGAFCGCVLINQHYVLTASHCVNGKDIPPTFRPYRIILGEWDTKTNPDCFEGDCAPPIEKVLVSKVTPHPQYVPTSTNQFHDIAIIRMQTPVTYTDFIKPICLPVESHLRTKLHIGESMEVSGWGKTETQEQANRKLKVRVNGVERSSCQAVYKQQGRQIESTQVCAGGERGKDSCNGDSGGPLVAIDNSNPRQLSTYLVGVVSYGPNPCAQAGWPGVYTKVSEYMDWVQSTMEP